MTDNRPKKGSTIKVEPIRDPAKLRKIERMLAENPRNYALFVVGCNTALRASDLVNIRIGDVRHLQPGDSWTVREIKTRRFRKDRRITLNKKAHRAVQALLDTLPEERRADTMPLFQSLRGGAKLTVGHVHKLVKSWCRQVKLPGNYGSHTLRKSFGYHQRVSFGVGLAELVDVFGHSTQTETLEYLCIQPEEIRDIYMNEI